MRRISVAVQFLGMMLVIRGHLRAQDSGVRV